LHGNILIAVRFADQPHGSASAMNTEISSLLSAKQQLLEREAECRRMSALPTLTPEPRTEFKKMADYRAQLAEAVDE
jgi:hypothetical protein